LFHEIQRKKKKTFFFNNFSKFVIKK